MSDVAARLRHTLPRTLLLALLLVMGLSAATSPAARAQENSPLTISARALYDGNVKYGEWLPLLVSLENDGADLRGELRALAPGSNNQATYAQRVELPSGARKSVTLHVLPNNFARRIDLQFIADGASEPIAESAVTVRPRPNIRFMAGVVSPGGEGLAPLAGADLRGEGNQRDEALLLSLTLADLPERPEALRTLDLLVLAGVDSRELTPAQQQALEQYVLLGGVLALGGGADAGRVLAGLPDSLQPVTLAGEAAPQTLEPIAALAGEEIRVAGPFPMAIGRSTPGSDVRLESTDGPLIVERPVGRGVVIWLALDPTLNPFDAWSGTTEFWRELLGSRAFYPGNLPPDISQRQIGNEQLGYAMLNLPSLDLPSLGLLIPLLAAYILMVGPINYFVLRRRAQLELAWLTIPAVTLIFSSGAYLLGFQLRGSDILLNQVSIVETIAGGEGAYVRSMIGIFSPARRSYALSVEGEALLSPATNARSNLLSESAVLGDAVFLQGQPARIERFDVDQWSMQGLMSERVTRENFGVEGQLTLEGRRVVGELTNGSDRLWQDVVVVVGANFEHLGTIPPGESRPVSVVASSFDVNARAELAWRLFEANFGPERNRMIQVRQQVASSVFDGATGRSNDEPMMLAWLDGPVTEVTLDGSGEPREVATTLLLAELPLGYQEGPVTLSPGRLDARLVSSTGSVCQRGSEAGLAPDFTVAEYEFTLPRELRQIEAEALILQVQPDGPWSAPPLLSLLQPDADRYDPVSGQTIGTIRVTDAARYIASNGVIRLRIERPDIGRFEGCIFINLGVEGTLPPTTGIGGPTAAGGGS